MSIYNDRNPEHLEAWLNTLSTHDFTLFNAGYAVAIRTLLEEMSTTRAKIAYQMFQVREQGDTEWEAQLLARMQILDNYEQNFSARLKNMQTPF